MTRATLTLLLTAAALSASNGYSALQMIPDARSVALAEAGVAYTGAGPVSYHNPALLASAPRIGAAWIHTPWLYGLYYDHYAASFRPSNRITAGLHISYLDWGRGPYMDPQGRIIGYYHLYDSYLGMTGAFRVDERVDLGLTAKVIYSNYDFPGRNDRAMGLALDVGGQYRPLDWLSLAAACENMGASLRYWEHRTTELPLMLRFGAEARPRLPGRFELAIVTGLWREVSARHPYTTSDSALVDWWEGIEKGLGVELWFARVACARVGYYENVAMDRGGLVLHGNELYRSSILRYLTQRGLGRIDAISLSYGIGLRFRALTVDMGVADDIGWGLAHYKFQLSWEM